LPPVGTRYVDPGLNARSNIDSHRYSDHTASTEINIDDGRCRGNGGHVANSVGTQRF
jgi:hypothetical protein